MTNIDNFNLYYIMSCVAGLSQMTVRGKSVESSVPMLWAHQQTGDTGTVNTWSLAGIHGTMLHTLLINWLVKVGPPAFSLSLVAGE